MEKDPNDYQALYNLLHIFEQLSEEDESINFLNSILEKNPYCEVAWHQLGKIYLKKGNHKEAISAFDFAIISDDSFTGAYIEKGKILETIGKLNSAIENYHIANEINDPSAFVYHRIASCHKALGNKDLSLLYFKKTILIFSEQGIGDLIQFSRYLFVLRDRFSCKVILRLKQNLAHFFDDSLKKINFFVDFLFGFV